MSENDEALEDFLFYIHSRPDKDKEDTKEV